MSKKLRIGWFSFSCSEDSTIIFTELLNNNWKEWKKKIDFRSALILQKKSKIDNLHVAFVEGAIASKKQEEELRKIRMAAKKLVAIGACACIGMPSSQRNSFDQQTKKEIEPILTRFKYAPIVKRLSDIVTVDEQVQGCPMNEEKFLQVLGKYLEEFGIT